jgi:hypothetical protein
MYIEKGCNVQYVPRYSTVLWQACSPVHIELEALIRILLVLYGSWGGTGGAFCPGLESE